MNLQVYDNPEFGKVRVLGDYDNPLFCLSDVCKIVDLDASAVMRRLDDGVISSHPITDSLGRVQNANFVNEDGLYDVILDSRKTEAKRFRKWITSEVLPSIRKTGGYVKEIDSTFLFHLAERMKRLEMQKALLTTQVAELKPKATYCDVVLKCPDLVSTSQIAKDYGLSAKTFNKLLHNLGVQYNQGGVWLLYQKYARRGWTQTKTHAYFDGLGNERCRVHTYWTQKGRLELYHLLGKNGYCPTIERMD